MKKINFKGLTAAFLSLMLISSMVIIHSSATSGDFKTKYADVLNSLSAVVGPDTITEKVTAETAESYDNANKAYKLLSADEQKALETYDADITNKLEACARRAKIFTEGSFYFDFDNDSALAKYLYTGQGTNEFVFSTVQHGTAIPEIEETFIYHTADGLFSAGVQGRGCFIDRINGSTSGKYPMLRMESGVYTSDDGKTAYLNKAYSWADPRFLTDSSSYDGAININDFAVGDFVDSVYQPRNLTIKITYATSDSGATYYPKYELSNGTDKRSSSRSDLSAEKSSVASNVLLTLSDYTGSKDKYKQVKALRVSYPEILKAKCAEANEFAETLDVTNIDITMSDIINKYSDLVAACGDNNYITSENKAKLVTAKKVSDYLVKNNIDKIHTPASIDSLSTVITDKTAVTKLYKETQDIINLDLGGMFSDAQLAKINSMNNAVGLMGEAEYDATDLVKAAVAIAELNKKLIVNDISFEVELTKTEKAVSALGTYTAAVSNKSLLEGIRVSYDTLVKTGKYTDPSNYVFEKTGKRYTNNDDWGWESTSDYGVVSYVKSPSLKGGINKISFTLPVSGYNKAGNFFVYSYDGIDSAADLANISAFGFFARQDNIYTGDNFTVLKESAKASTTLIPQDNSYYPASMYAYGTSQYKTRLETDRVPADYGSLLSDKNNLVWHHTKENVGNAVTNQDLRTDLDTYMSEKGYNKYTPNGNMNVTMEYQGDTNLVKGYNWYLITVSGRFYTTNGDTSKYEDGTVYCRLFTKGRITTAGVTHDASAEPTDVLTNLDIEVNKTPTALTAGASVRIADVKNGGGIRFESKVNTDLYNSLKNTEGVTVSLGTIIVPEEYRNGKDINFDNFKTAPQGGTNEAKNLCVDITQTKWQDEANGIYTAALINLKEANYTKQFAARGYMKVTYADGHSVYYYSDFDADGNVRSIQAVASAALADTSATYTEAQKAILKVFAGQS